MNVDKVNYCEHPDLFIAGFPHVKLLSAWAKSEKRENIFPQ